MSENHQEVIKSIENRYYEEEKFSAVRDIVEWTGLPESRVRRLVEDLTGEHLFVVYEGHGKPTVYITRQMRNSIFSETGEPDWIERYEFSEKSRIRKKISKDQEKLSNYVKLEKLLYAGGPSLESAVEEGLNLLGFNTETTEEDEDFVIRHDDKVYIIEVKGKSGRVKKGDVAQLGTWLDKWIDKEKAEKLIGILLVNHYRNLSPKEREEPLTKKAREFLNLRPAFYVSTPELFEIIKKVKEEKISKESGRKIFLSKGRD